MLEKPVSVLALCATIIAITCFGNQSPSVAEQRSFLNSLSGKIYMGAGLIRLTPPKGLKSTQNKPDVQKYVSLSLFKDNTFRMLVGNQSFEGEVTYDGKFVHLWLDKVNLRKRTGEFPLGCVFLATDVREKRLLLECRTFPEPVNPFRAAIVVEQ